MLFTVNIPKSLKSQKVDTKLNIIGKFDMIIGVECASGFPLRKCGFLFISKNNRPMVSVIRKNRGLLAQPDNAIEFFV